MSVSAQLVSERGEIIEEVFDEEGRLRALIESVPEFESTHCIQYMNPYGDTIFNQLQLVRFLEEWKMVEAQADTEEEKEIVASVQRLALLAEEENHMYIKFVGD
jgi:PAS domain-containing protein